LPGLRHGGGRITVLEDNLEAFLDGVIARIGAGLSK